ncbi:MAG: undecaprenyl-diphosphate phosphatase [bacterium]
MNIFQGFFLGLIQGLTEFLPVSSSAHLVFIPKMFGFSSSIPFDVVVHLATALAVIFYFWQDIKEMFKAFFVSLFEAMINKKTLIKSYRDNLPFRISCLILLGTIPTGFIGLAFNDLIESWFNSILAVGIFLLITGLILWTAEYLSHGKRSITGIQPLDALLIGLAQGCAIAPGLSRSGTTISTALLRGFDRKVAAEFSFLMSLPAILGAGLVKSKDIVSMGVFGSELWPMFFGGLAAFISAYIAIKFFLNIIRKTSIEYFAYYCWLVGGALIMWSLMAS